MRKDIKTLEDLEKEKEKLKMTMTVTKDALAKSLGTNRKELKSFALKNVAIPAGILGLGTFAVKKISESNQSEDTEPNTNIMKNVFGGIFPVVLNFVQAYLLKKQKETIDEKASNTTSLSTTESKTEELIYS